MDDRALGAEERLEATRAVELAARVLTNLRSVVHAPEQTLEFALLCLLAEGHLIIEDFPGVGKTTLAKSLARSIHCAFSRLQFTPDLLPSDVTGVNVFNQRSNEFEFRPGPVFANILLVDEINRASPKTQSALLECMQERQVTVDGVSYQLPPPFMVMATQNPIEYEGTYPLPEAQLDRFLLRTAFGYPAREHELEVLGRRIERGVDELELRPLVDRETLLDMQQAIEQVYVAESVRGYCVDLATATRRSESSAVGASPRGSLALLKLARCKAALAGRDFVLPDDVKAVAVPALSHRLVLRPELWVQRISAEDVTQTAS